MPKNLIYPQILGVCIIGALSCGSNKGIPEKAHPEKNLSLLTPSGKFQAECEDERNALLHSSYKIVAEAVYGIPFDKQLCQSLYEEILTIPHLFLRAKGLSNLQPLSYFEHFETLDVGENPIKDFSAVWGQLALQRLWLDKTEFENWPDNIEPLQFLRQLDISETSLQSLAFLSDLKNLVSLNLSFVQVEASQWGYLRHATLLRRLTLRNADITDIQFTQFLTYLQSLDLRFNEISDISPLRHLSELLDVKLEGNPVLLPLNKNGENCPVEDVSSSIVYQICSQ